MFLYRLSLRDRGQACDFANLVGEADPDRFEIKQRVGDPEIKVLHLRQVRDLPRIGVAEPLAK